MNTPRIDAGADTTRREFGKALAALAAVPLVPVLEAGAAEKEPPTPDIARALAQVVQLRYGKHLSAEQRNQILLSILRSQKAAERMREFKLSNSDEPAFTFRADLP